MTNFDPGGFLMLLTVIPAVVGGTASVGGAHLATRLGYGEYATNVVAILGVLIAAWVGAAVVVSTDTLAILAVTLSMVGAYGATRSVTAASYGWVLGVVLLFAVFVALSALGVYRGVDQTGAPQGLIARNLGAFYYGGLLASGAIAGRAVDVLLRLRPRSNRRAP